VRAGIGANSDADLDRPGVRVGVLERAGADGYLTKTLKQAQIVRAGTAGELFELLVSGKIDAAAGTKTRLFEEAAKLPGSRVLDGRILVEPIGMAVPKGRSNLAMNYVDEFVAEAKENGLVKKAIDNAGLRGVTVAPLK
jgi:polar amino acid transport system substrate-binding protein